MTSPKSSNVSTQDTPHGDWSERLPTMTMGQGTVGDSGTMVERRPLVSQVPGWNPVLSGFYLCDFTCKRRENWLCFQEADIECDNYKLKACLAIDVKKNRY